MEITFGEKINITKCKLVHWHTTLSFLIALCNGAYDNLQCCKRVSEMLDQSASVLKQIVRVQGKYSVWQTVHTDIHRYTKLCHPILPDHYSEGIMLIRVHRGVFDIAAVFCFMFCTPVDGRQIPSVTRTVAVTWISMIQYAVRMALSTSPLAMQAARIPHPNSTPQWSDYISCKGTRLQC